MANISALLQAAEFLERREREAEHGYASTLPEPSRRSPTSRHHGIRKQANKFKKSQGANTANLNNRSDRSTHNELEKNRRAHLRHCLERLKDIVPLGSESSRHTTLGLLTRAKHFIKTLEDRERRQNDAKERLFREQQLLINRLTEMGGEAPEVALHRRSSSECSNFSSVVSSESDDIDVEETVYMVEVDIESDDSSRSNSSDGGMTNSARRRAL